MASEYTSSPVPEKFAMVLLSVTALADTLSRLNVDIDVNCFIDEVNKASEHHAPPLTAVLSPEQVNQCKKGFHKGEHISLCCSRLLSVLVASPATVATLSNAGHPVPAPKESVVMKITESSLSDAACEKRRKMLAATRAAFKNTVPTPYVVVWAGNFENLQFIHGLDIVMLAEDDSDHDSDQQVCSEWCLWDTGAQITMIPGGRRQGWSQCA
jgi:hypothetical protein